MDWAVLARQHSTTHLRLDLAEVRPRHARALEAVRPPCSQAARYSDRPMLMLFPHHLTVRQVSANSALASLHRIDSYFVSLVAVHSERSPSRLVLGPEAIWNDTSAKVVVVVTARSIWLQAFLAAFVPRLLMLTGDQLQS